MIWFFCLVAIWSLSGVACEDEFVTAGYLPEYRSYINVNNTAPYLTDLILFSMAPDDEGNIGPCCLGQSHFEQAREAQMYKKDKFPGKIDAICIRIYFESQNLLAGVTKI